MSRACLPASRGCNRSRPPHCRKSRSPTHKAAATRSRAFKGRSCSLNLWATWCAPCVRELPALAKLQAAMPQGGLTVVAVNVGRGSPADTLAFLKATRHRHLTGYLDPDLGLMHVFGAFGLPLSVLFDPKGREIAQRRGLRTGTIRRQSPISNRCGPRRVIGRPHRRAFHDDGFPASHDRSPSRSDRLPSNFRGSDGKGPRGRRGRPEGRLPSPGRRHCAHRR